MSLSRQFLSCHFRGFRVSLQGMVFLVSVCVCAVSALGGVIPSIGGTPTETDEDVFTSPEGDWEAVVYSYAFVGADEADDVPAGLPDPIDGQTLFAYVPQMVDLATASIDQFQVGIPFGDLVLVAGHSETILPEPGFVEEDRQNPSGTQVSLPAMSVTYLYNGDFSFDAGEFSVLYFLSEGIPGQVPATMRGGASVTDEQEILGPIPEPASGAIMIGGILYAVLTRRYVGRVRSVGRSARI